MCSHLDTHAGRGVQEDPLWGAADARANGSAGRAAAGECMELRETVLTRDTHMSAQWRLLQQRVRE